MRTNLTTIYQWCNGVMKISRREMLLMINDLTLKLALDSLSVMIV
jgi:hypothetical protein